MCVGAACLLPRSRKANPAAPLARSRIDMLRSLLLLCSVPSWLSARTLTEMLAQVSANACKQSGHGYPATSLLQLTAAAGVKISVAVSGTDLTLGQNRKRHMRLLNNLLIEDLGQP